MFEIITIHIIYLCRLWLLWTTSCLEVEELDDGTMTTDFNAPSSFDNSGSVLWQLLYWADWLSIFTRFEDLSFDDCLLLFFYKNLKYVIISQGYTKYNLEYIGSNHFPLTLNMFGRFDLSLRFLISSRSPSRTHSSRKTSSREGFWYLKKVLMMVVLTGYSLKHSINKS